jgi:hypothetical protein
MLDVLFRSANHIDTAPGYGDSDLRIGAWMPLPPQGLLPRHQDRDGHRPRGQRGLGLPGVFLNMAGDATLLPKVPATASRFAGRPGDDEMAAMLEAQRMTALFGVT